MNSYSGIEDSSPEKMEKMFAANDIPVIARLFKEACADSGRGLDKQEFCEVMKKIYSSVSEEELAALYMQIDTHCKGTVNLDELVSFLLSKIEAYEALDYMHHSFPKPFQRVPMDCQSSIVGLVFQPLKDDMKYYYSADFRCVVRPYKKGQYLSMTSNGTLSIWNDTFENSRKLSLWTRENALPFSHIKKMCVRSMEYIRELKQLVVANTTQELIFYDCRLLPVHIEVKYALVVDEDQMTTMNYWSNGTKAVFSYGDVAGFLTFFISHDVKKHGLFCHKAFEKISLQKYPTVYVSTLIRHDSRNFQCMKVHAFNDVCSQIRYFPSLHSIAICGNSFKTMVVLGLPKPTETDVSKEFFNSEGIFDFFTCVEYAPAVEQLVTGGTDGSLRVWFPSNPSCIETLKGHDKPITNLMYNTKDQILISLSEDKNVRVWSEVGWLCRQSIQVENIGQAPITSICYNIHNNELVLANSDITKCLGEGTDVFRESLTSHEKPLCCALYHSFFKRVISCCQKGEVTVWDILTGNAVMQFQVTPSKTNRHTFMSFDGQQQSLITVCQDGKLRRWNFSNGKELAVHPVTVQKYVTAIVCIENRMFVSGRDSKVIFDLDIEGYDNGLLKHAYLKDITSMDAHGDRLITASSNGNIIIWDHKNGDVLCWIDASTSPRTRMAGESAQGLREILPVQNNTSKSKGTGRESTNSTAPTEIQMYTSPLIVCLKTRDAKADTATLLTSADGYIYAWSVICTGGLLGKFRAVKDDVAVITTMSTDVNEEILLTGDSTGRICRWDIRRFGFKRQANNGPFEKRNGWLVSLCPPPLLESWQAHPTAVVSVECDPACTNIITAGLDCNVCQWTNKGICIGVFGKDRWDTTQLHPKEDPDEGQTENSDTDELFSVKRIAASPVPDYDKFINRIWPKKGSKAELLAKCRKAATIRPELDKDIDRSKTKFVPHPPKTSRRRRETHLEQSSAQAASPDRSKYRRAQKRAMLEVNVLIPCPPESLPNKQGSHRIPRHLYMPYTQHSTHLKPHPSQSRPTTDHDHAAKGSPDTQHRSDHKSKNLRLPPIVDKSKLIHHQT